MLLVEDVKIKINVHLEDIKIYLVYVKLFVPKILITLPQLAMIMNVLLDIKLIKLIKLVFKVQPLQDVLNLNSSKEESVLIHALQASIQILKIVFVRDVHLDVIAA